MSKTAKASGIQFQPRIFLHLLFTASFLYALYFVISTSNQLLLDLHSFRQSQTALTTFWLNSSPNFFAYYTPVIGAPWSVPFEFPTYQVIVHLLASLFNLPLIPTGRILSFIFLLLLFYPIRAIVKAFNLDKNVTYIVSILMLTSSVYLYWSRSFMIETLALLLTMNYIALLTIYREKESIWIFSGAVFFGILAGVTKSTTAISGFVVALVYVCLIFRNYFSGRKSFRRAIISSFTLFIPLVISWLWVQYSDYLKNQNMNGESLTSTALSSWTYGSLSQRTGSSFWLDLVITRSLLGNLGAGLGAIVICRYLLLFYGKNKEKSYWVALSSIFLFLVPLLIFSNLHIVHWYYQVSVQIFLFFALAIALTSDLRLFKVDFERFNLILLVFIITANLGVFFVKFEDSAYVKFTPSNSLILQVSSYLKQNTSPENPILVYGLDWNSELSFASERKSATLAPWMKGYEQSFTNPSSQFEGENPGAIVDCFWREDNAIIHPTLQELDEVSKLIGLSNYSLIGGICSIWSKR